MTISKQLHRLATNPSDHLKFLATGQLPRGVTPKGLLVELLKQIAPRDRVAITGLKVDPKLGYQGSRVFHTAEQAFRWVHPDSEVFGGFPAESWRIKSSGPRLTIDDLLEQATKVPEGLVERYPQLRRPEPPEPKMDPEADDPVEPRVSKPRP